MFYDDCSDNTFCYSHVNRRHNVNLSNYRSFIQSRDIFLLTRINAAEELFIPVAPHKDTVKWFQYFFIKHSLNFRKLTFSWSKGILEKVCQKWNKSEELCSFAKQILFSRFFFPFKQRREEKDLWLLRKFDMIWCALPLQDSRNGGFHSLTTITQACSRGKQRRCTLNESWVYSEYANS